MKLKSNWNIFIPENALENVIYEISAILSKGRCVESNVHMRKWINIIYTSINYGNFTQEYFEFCVRFVKIV